MSPRDALEWASRGRALEDELGRLRGERARTSRGCGGVSAGQGGIGARGGLDVRMLSALLLPVRHDRFKDRRDRHDRHDAFRITA